ncbi:acetylornithine transaminase [Corynebacterium glucuronolyticum]|uniref:acetylornithine transaminase n=1 Tax=Corynebacterium glucuronolyticum TaxID=39791 RepID=UPI00019C1D0B|nr:aminotransferase, acetylornithine/succinylornithine family [Corynebacterium glucuronolyticum ATCC 51867]
MTPKEGQGSMSQHDQPTPGELTTRWESVMMDNYGTPALEIVSGHGSWLVTTSGKEVLDMVSGIAVNALGYAHPHIIAAIEKQAHTIGHTSNLAITEPAVHLAERLVQRFPIKDARVFFCNSGAEANEAAFKIARRTGRPRILAASGGFHGRTMGSLALTGQPKKQAPFTPLPPGVEFFPYGDLDSLSSLVDDSVAAIILEPIQGEVGVIPAPDGFLSGVRELCDAHGVLLIIDEVQTGVGRTGEFFAFSHSGIVPDIVTMAKALGGGLPMGAVIAHGTAVTLLGPGDHGSTFGGNPIVAAAANAVLDVIDDQLLSEISRKGALLARLTQSLPHVAEVRGRGLMVGLVLDADIAKDVSAQALEQGLFVNAPSATVIRLVPPLTISDEEISKATEILHSVLQEIP